MNCFDKALRCFCIEQSIIQHTFERNLLKRLKIIFADTQLRKVVDAVWPKRVIRDIIFNHQLTLSGYCN